MLNSLNNWTCIHGERGEAAPAALSATPSFLSTGFLSAGNHSSEYTAAFVAMPRVPRGEPARSALSATPSKSPTDSWRVIVGDWWNF